MKWPKKKGKPNLVKQEKKKKPKEKEKQEKEEKEEDNHVRRWTPERFRLRDSKKVPLIVFGDGMFNKSAVHLKGLKTGVVGVLWRALKRREAAGNLLVITIDEYFTSRTCNNCRSNTVEALKTVQAKVSLPAKPVRYFETGTSTLLKAGWQLACQHGSQREDLLSFVENQESHPHQPLNSILSLPERNWLDFHRQTCLGNCSGGS